MTQHEGTDSQAEDTQGTTTKIDPGERRAIWQRHIETWRSSNLSQMEFCRQHGLKWSRFNYWRKRLQEADNGLEFVQMPMASADIGVGLVLIISDRFKVEVADNFNPSTLASVVRTLAQL